VRAIQNYDFQEIKNAFVKSVYYTTSTNNLFSPRFDTCVTRSNVLFAQNLKNKGVAASWSAHKHNSLPNLIDRFILNLELED